METDLHFPQGDLLNREKVEQEPDLDVDTKTSELSLHKKQESQTFFPDRIPEKHVAVLPISEELFSIPTNEESNDIEQIVEQYSADYDITDVFCHDKQYCMYEKSTGIVATNISNPNNKPYLLSRLKMKRSKSEQSWAWRLYYHRHETLSGMIGIMNTDNHAYFTPDIYQDKRVVNIFLGFQSMYAFGKCPGLQPNIGGKDMDAIVDVKLTLSGKGSGKKDGLFVIIFTSDQTSIV